MFIGDDVYLENGVLSDCSLDRKDAFAMVQRRAKAAGIQPPIGCPHLPGNRHHDLPHHVFLSYGRTDAQAGEQYRTLIMVRPAKLAHSCR